MGAHAVQRAAYASRVVSDPHAGSVFQGPDGRPMLFVRTEDRPGPGGAEHYFVSVVDRNVTHRWEAKLPAEFEMVLDTQGRAQANQEQWLRHVAEHEIEIVLDLLRQACAWLPRERARELRQRYADAHPKP